MEFAEGNRVIYVSGNYPASRDNPLIGTKWECQGIITDYDESYIRVEWDNGRHNSYLQYDLQLVGTKANDPNSAFRLKKRR
jgi:hypothetical protein